MLSSGAVQIKLNLGITPIYGEEISTDGKGESSEVNNEHIDCLSPRSKEFIAGLREGLDENNSDDEALEHRDTILGEFRSLCRMQNISEEEIEDWDHLAEISEDDRLFVQAMDEYAEWGISQKEHDTPMDVYHLGRTFASFLTWYEKNTDGLNLFYNKSESLLEEDPEKARAIIAIRSIANGN